MSEGEEDLQEQQLITEESTEEVKEVHQANHSVDSVESNESEASEHQHSPKLAWDDDETNTGQRLYDKGREFLILKESKMEKERMKKKRADEQELTFKPQISKLAKTMRVQRDNYYDYNSEWRKRIDLELQRKRAEKQLMEDEESKVTAPVMSRKTQQIIKRQQQSKAYIGPISGWEKRFDQYRASRTEIDEYQEFAPKIDAKSEKLAKRKVSHESAFERLYNLSQSKKPLEEDLEHQQLSTKPHRKKSDQREFVDDLIHRGEEAEKRKEILKREIEDQMMQFSPKINKTSLKMIQHIERKPLYSPPVTSKHSPRGSHNHSIKSNGRHDSELSGSHSFSSPRQGKDFHERRAVREQQKQERIEHMKRLKEEDMMKECTFKPHLNENSRVIAYQHAIDDEDDISHYLNKISNASNISATEKLERQIQNSWHSPNSSFTHQRKDRDSSPEYYSSPLYQSFQSDMDYSGRKKPQRTLQNIVAEKRLSRESSYSSFRLSPSSSFASEVDNDIAEIEHDVNTALQDWSRLESMMQ